MKVLRASLFVFALICAVCVQAFADDTWDSGGGDGDWSTDANWADNGQPTGDIFESLTFTGTGEVTNNDLGDNLGYRFILFDSGAGAFTLNGDIIEIDTGGSITNSSSSTQTVNAGIVTDQTAGGATLLFSTPNIATMVFGGQVDLSDAADVLTTVVGGFSSIIIDANIIGSGAIVHNGTGTLFLNGNNTFTGGITVTEGELHLDTSTAAGTGTITVNGGVFSTIDYAANIDVSNTISLVNFFSTDLNVDGGEEATQRGAITTTLGSQTLNKTGGGDLNMRADIGTLANPIDVVINDGALRMRLFQAADIYGNVTVNSGGTFETRDVDNQVSGSVTANSGGTVLGDGTMGDVGVDTDVLTINSGGTLMPGNSVGTMIVNGDYVQNSGGMLDIEVDTAINLGDADGNDLLDVTGNAYLFSGSLIRVRAEGDDPFSGDGDTDLTADFLDFDGASDTGSDDPDGLGDDEFTIIDIGDDLETDPRIINVPIWTNYGIDTLGSDVSTSDLDGLLIFAFIPFEDSLDLLPATFLGLAGPTGADSVNPGMGNAIDDVIAVANAGGTPSTAVQDFIEGFLGFLIPGDDGYTTLNLDDWKMLIDETDASLNTVGIPSHLVITDGFRGFNNNQTTYLQARREGNVDAFARSHQTSQLGGPMLASMELNPAVMVDALNTTVLAQPDPVVEDGARTQDWGAWIKGFGLTNELDTIPNRTGYESDSYGVMGGVDYMVAEGLVIGVSAGYIDTQADFDLSLGDIDVNTYRVGPYLSYAQGQWYVEASATYGHSEMDRSRTTTLLGTSTSDNEANDWTFSLGGGYTFDLNEQLSVTPINSVYYIHFDQEGYTETGGVMPLTIADYESDALYTRLGARVTYRINHENLVIVPEIFAGWEHEFLQDDEPVDASLLPGGVGAFTVRVAEPESDSAFFGGGISVLINDNVTIFGRYDGLYNGDTEAHGISGGVTVWF